MPQSLSSGQSPLWHILSIIFNKSYQVFGILLNDNVPVTFPLAFFGYHDEVSEYSQGEYL
jgi:hypothetical protein